MNWRAGQNPFLRFPVRSLFLLFLACLPVLPGLKRVEVRPDARILLEGDQRNLATYDKVNEILNRDTVVVISMEGSNLFSQQGFDDLRRVCDRLSELPGIVDVKSLTHSVKPVRQGMSFEMVKFVPEGLLSDGEIQRIRQYCLSHPLVRNVMVAEDGKHLLITATFQRKLATQAQRQAFRVDVDTALSGFAATGYRFRILALPFAEEEVYRHLTHDLKVTSFTVVLTCGVILWLAFRSMRVLILMALNLAMTQLTFAGLMQMLGVAVTLYTALLFPLLAGVHLTLLIHIFHAFRSEAGASGHQGNALSKAVQSVFQSSAFAAMTTVIGLVSLAMCDVPEVRRFGLMGGLGVVWVFFWSFGPGLAMHQLAGMRDASPSKVTTFAAGEKRPVSPLAKWVCRRRGAILASGCFAAALAAVGMCFIRTDIRVAEFLDKSSPTRQALEEMNRVYGGINIVQIAIDSGHTNGVVDLAGLRYVEDVARVAQNQPGVSGVYSFPQLLAMMNQIWEQEKPGSLQLPDTPLRLNLFVAALKARNYPFLTALADPSLQKTWLVVRSQDMPSREYLEVVEKILAYAQTKKPANFTVSAAEGLHSILEADQRILRAQIDTAFITLGAVWLVLALLWRSAWLAFIAVLINVLPVSLVLGMAGVMDIPLNSVTVMIAALVLSIAVDDSVHFITAWREERARGKSADEALQIAFRLKGLPIITTSLVLMGVFFPFAMFSFPPLRDFGVMSAMAFGLALVSVLTLLPAILVGKEKGLQKTTRAAGAKEGG